MMNPEDLSNKYSISELERVLSILEDDEDDNKKIVVGP
jgi:hypothetical protein